MPEPEVQTTTDTTGAYPAGTMMGQGEDRLDTRNESLEEENRSKMLESGELTPELDPALAQEKVYNFTYGVPNPNFSSPVIDSSQARDEVDGQFAEVQNGLSQTQQMLQLPQYQQYQDFTGEVEASRGKNEDLYAKSVDTIEKDYEQRRLEQEDSNRLDVGFQTRQLARMKAFGLSASAMSLMKSVQVRNEREINKLLLDKQKLLLMAQESYQSKDWTMLNEKMAQSKAITDQINNIQEQMFQDSLRSAEEIRQQTKFGWEVQDRALGKLYEYGSLYESIDQIGEEEVARLENEAGVSRGFLERYFELSQEQAAQQRIKDDLEFQKSLVDLLSELPEDQSIVIGDTTISGWAKEKFDYWQTTMVDDYGNTTLVTFNQTTGVIDSFNLGKIGSTSMTNRIMNVDGALYNVDPVTGVAAPVMTKGKNIDPSYMSGFDQWMQSLGNVTVPFGGGTPGESVHPGWDIANEVGTAITAFKGGQVINVDTVGTGAYGRFVEVVDSEGLVWRYSHLNNTSVAIGDTLSSGTYIGGMGNTGTVYTTRESSDGIARTPSAEGLAKGYGAHLDLRVYVPDKPVGTTTTKGLPSGATQDDLNNISLDMNSINSETDPKKRYDLYKKIRDSVAQGGSGLLNWFDDAYPIKNYEPSEEETKTLGQLAKDERKSLPSADVTKRAKEEGISFTQLTLLYDSFDAYSGVEIIRMAKEMGASYKEIERLLKEEEKWDKEEKKLAKDLLK